MKKLFSFLALCFLAIQCAFAAVNLNTATEAELEKLPGIGPVKAKAIIEERSKSGGFKNIEEIKKVKGIGDATFDKLKSEITVSGTTATATAATAPAAKAVAAPKAAKADVKVDAKADAKVDAKASAGKK